MRIHIEMLREKLLATRKDADQTNTVTNHNKVDEQSERQFD